MDQFKRNVNGVEKAAIRIRRGIATGLMSLAFFGITAGATYLFIPAKHETITPDDNGTDITPDIPDTGDNNDGRGKLIQNLLAEVTGEGLRLNVDNGYVSFNSDSENKLTFDNAKVDLALSSIDTKQIIKGINLKVNAPVNYCGKTRSLALDKIEDYAYFDISNDDEGNIDDAARNYNFRYKVNLATKTPSEYGGKDSNDPTTGGEVIYNYGDFSYVVDTILNILTADDSGLHGKINFPSFSTIIGGDSSSEGNTNTENSSSESSMDTDAILDAFNNMKEGKYNDNPYYLLELPVGNDTYKIGLATDKQYNLAKVDFPAKVSLDNGNTYTDNQEEFAINSETKLKISASVYSGSEANIDWVHPKYEALSYREIYNSLDLFKEVASLVAVPKFGLKMNLDLGRSSEGREASLYVTEKQAQEEKAYIDLDADVDFSKYSLNSIGASLNIGKYVKEDNVLTSTKDKASQTLEVKKLENADDFYLGLNTALKAKTNKTTIDTVYSNIKNAIDGMNGGETTTKQIKTTKRAISASIDAVTNSGLANGIEQKRYDWALDMLEEFKNSDNKIWMTLNLEPAGINGKIKIVLDRTVIDGVKPSLAKITFENIEFASFTLNGALEVDRSMYDVPTLEEASKYQELTHLVGLSEQISSIVSSKQALINLSGSIKDESKKDVVGNNYTGFVFDGKVAVDANDMKVGMDIKGVEHNSSYLNDHSIKMDLNQNDAANGIDSVNIKYSSANESSSELEKRTNPKSTGLVATLSTTSMMNSLKDIMDTFNIDQTDDENKSIGIKDDRFNRLFSCFSNESSSSLLSSITNGKYFDLLDTKVLEKADFTSGNGTANEFIVNGDSLGLRGKATIKVQYETTPTGENNPRFKSMTITSGEVTKFEVTIGLEKTSLNEADKTSYLDCVEILNSDKVINLNNLIDMLSYGVATTMIGAKDNYNTSTYSFDADVSIVLGKYEFTALRVNLVAKVRGAQTMLYATLDNLPVIKGINAPEGMPYFRDAEYSGARDVALYYYADGYNPKGFVTMTRNSSYGAIRNVTDSVTISGDNFFSNMGEWILKYLIGVNETFFEQKEENGNTATTTETPSNPITSKAIHIEDVIGGYEVNNNTHSLNLDLNALTHLPFFGETRLDVTCADLDGNNGKAISRLALSAGISLGGELKVCSIKLDAKLNNISDTGVYSNAWEIEGNKFKSIYSPTYEASNGKENPFVLAKDNYYKQYNENDGALTAGNYYVKVSV